jgi:hypothetical protein
VIVVVLLIVPDHAAIIELQDFAMSLKWAPGGPEGQKIHEYGSVRDIEAENETSPRRTRKEPRMIDFYGDPIRESIDRACSEVAK